MAEKQTAARVLCDAPSHGLKAGQVLRAPAGLIKTLTDDGSVDPHPDAVAYAESIGAEVITLGEEPAPRQRKPRAADPAPDTQTPQD
jgi:hypothetical protein